MKLGDVVRKIVIDPRKLTDYALNPANPKGASKAIMFQQHLGFTQDNFEILLNQILTKAIIAKTVVGNCDQHGQRYQVDLEIEGVEYNQRETVRTGWIVEPFSDTARLVTIYVKKRP